MFLWDWYGPIAIALLALMAFAAAIFHECPLTRWERAFRDQTHGLLPYEGPCVGYYAHRLLGLRLSVRRVKIINTSVGFLLLVTTLFAATVSS